MSRQAQLRIKYPVGSFVWLRTNPEVDPHGTLKLLVSISDDGRLIAVKPGEEEVCYDMEAWYGEFMDKAERDAFVAENEL